MRKIFFPIAVTLAASFLMSSCALPEPTPRNVHVGMTKEQVLKKFGNPDVYSPRKEYSMPVLQPTPTGGMGVLDMLPGYQPEPVWKEEIVTQPERFIYYNQDGSLATSVFFGEDGRVFDVMRAPVGDDN